MKAVLRRKKIVVRAMRAGVWLGMASRATKRGCLSMLAGSAAFPCGWAPVLSPAAWYSEASIFEGVSATNCRRSRKHDCYKIDLTLSGSINDCKMCNLLHWAHDFEAIWHSIPRSECQYVVLFRGERTQVASLRRTYLLVSRSRDL